MLKLIQQPCIQYVNKLLEAIEHQGGSTDKLYTRVWVTLGEQGLVMNTTHGDRTCKVVIYGAVSVEYTFISPFSVEPVIHRTTINDVEETAKTIVQFFDGSEI